jgi:LuxR family transcriptional regulator, maltose regulon positive regulatory protein
MPRIPLHALTWSRVQGHYELYTQGQLTHQFRPTEEAAWLAWLGEATSFAFHGASGSLNIYQEARPRGGSYWYAYHTNKRRTHKRYLGSSAQVTFARLEETAQALARASTSPELSASRTQPPAEQLPPLSARLAQPRLPHALVERERLLLALDRALLTPLTLLSAPAGFGKTTLLSSWASRHPAQVAWLELSELDNSPTRFWVSLIAALRRCGSYAPGLGETALALFQSPQPPPLVTCLSALLQELESHEAHPAPLVLMVDDYQVIEDPVIHESLSFFLEHLPASLHLILSSRVDPDLPLARLRVRGQLTEIRMDDLRFDQEEACDFLSHMLSPALSAEEVQRLVDRTEGWIAGLQLAALTLQKRADRAAFLQVLSGSQRYLLDYVQEEILARLPESVRDFLLSTSILSRLDASVCQAVTAAPERRTSQQMLVFLERANLFLVPLDEERRTYRLHELFREALLSVLYTTRPERVPVLHRRAARFYVAEGQWTEAIAHALEAADFSTAARLMEQTVEQFWLHGEAATMVRWALALPEQMVRKHARLVLTTALYLLHTVTQMTREQRARVYQQVRQLMARVEAALWREGDEIAQEISATGSVDLEAREALDALLHRRLRLLRMYLVFFESLASGHYEHLNSMQQEIEEELDRDEEAIWQMVPLVFSFILHYTVWQTGAQLLPRLLAAKEQVSRKASPFASLRVRQFLAFVALEAGQLRLASQESRAALDLIEQSTGYALLKGYFEVVLAQVFYQWNRLEEARSLLHAVVQDAAAWQHLDLLGFGYSGLLQVALVTADGSLAQEALHEFEQLVQRERYADYPDRLSTIRAHWWLAQGQLEAASDWAAGVVFPQGAWEVLSYDAFLVVIQVYFAKQSFRDALELLERFSTHLDRPANIRITITYLAQLLVALHQTGKSEQAREVAARLFALTEPEGFIRVYLDLGEPMKHALKALLSAPANRQAAADSASFSRSYVVRLLAIFEQEESLAAKHPPNASLLEVLTPESLPPPADQRPLRMEPLSPQELKVLRLLVAGRTYAEMAENLIVSIHTIKTQVSSIYRKLGVSRRAEAIAASQQFSLL